jgi:hypothetical protein
MTPAPPAIDPAAPAPSTTTTDSTTTTTDTTTTTTDPSTISAPVPGETPSADPVQPVQPIQVNTPPPVVNVVTPPPPVPENRYVERTYVRETTGPRFGTGLVVGGGVTDFTGSNIGDVTNTGGLWQARLIFGTRQILGIEAAYVGTARDIRALGLANDALLVSNGVEGALRLNIPVIRGRTLVEPFGFVGAGWSRYNLAREGANTSNLAADDDVLEIPYGAGLAVGYAGFLADARFTYKSSFYNDLVRTNTSNGQLDNWSVGGQVGFEF